MKLNAIVITSSQKRRHFFLYALCVFLIAFLARTVFALFAFKNNAILYSDSYDYLRLADSVYQNLSYGFNSQEIFRVPVYPVFLALIKFFSSSSFIPLSIFTQLILDSLTAVMVFFLAIRLFEFKNKSLIFAAIAGLFYALSPLAISCSAQILSETLFAFILVALLLILLKFTKDNKSSVSYSMIIGLLMAVLTLTRAVFLPLSLLFLLFILIKTKSFKVFLLTGLTCYILLSGWGLRNYLYSNYFGISSVSAINTYRYNACALEAKITGKSFSEMQKEFDSRLSVSKTQKEQADYASKEGWEIILEHPFRYALIQLKTSLNTLLPVSGDLTRAFGLQLGDKGTLAVINSEGLIAGVKYYFAGNMKMFLILLPLSILLFLQYILSFIGSIKALKNEHEQFLFVLLVVLCAIYFILVGGPASTPRFRLPAEGIIFVLASYGLYAVCKFLSRRRNGN